MNRVDEIIERLEKLYPAPQCALNFSKPYELLFATILSAQCTDVRVNMVTKELFRKYRTLEDYARAPLEELEQDIRSTGFYRNKAKAIQGSARILMERFGSQVPADMEALLSLPGVARKTANVVMGNAFGIASGVVVDTHVLRLSRRLGLTDSDKPEKVEKDLAAQVPRGKWIDFSHLLIFHGRNICKARKTLCRECALGDLCPSFLLLQ